MKFQIAITLFLSLAACAVGTDDGVETEDSDVTYCNPKAIDTDGDGVANGLDINCDGKIDIEYNGGGGGTSSNKCSTVVTRNGQTQALSCTGSGSQATCECRVNGSLVQTCTQATTSCSIGYPNANCCGF